MQGMREEEKDESELKVSVLDQQFDQETAPMSASPLFGGMANRDSPVFNDGSGTPVLGDPIFTERKTYQPSPFASTMFRSESPIFTG